jgi:hypothetical protein
MTESENEEMMGEWSTFLDDHGGNMAVSKFEHFCAGWRARDAAMSKAAASRSEDTMSEPEKTAAFEKSKAEHPDAQSLGFGLGFEAGWHAHGAATANVAGNAVEAAVAFTRTMFHKVRRSSAPWAGIVATELIRYGLADWPQEDNPDGSLVLTALGNNALAADRARGQSYVEWRKLEDIVRKPGRWIMVTPLPCDDRVTSVRSHWTADPWPRGVIAWAEMPTPPNWTPTSDDPLAPATTASVIQEIAAERKRQIEVEGWDADHDAGQLAKAAACYAVGSTLPTQELSDRPSAARVGRTITKHLWPWDMGWWKPGNRRRELIKAGALIVAEIERLDRVAPDQTSFISTTVDGVQTSVRYTDDPLTGDLGSTADAGHFSAQAALDVMLGNVGGAEWIIRHDDSGEYFLAPNNGSTPHREDAHRYSKESAEKVVSEQTDGKYTILRYADAERKTPEWTAEQQAAVIRTIFGLLKVVIDDTMNHAKRQSLGVSLKEMSAAFAPAPEPAWPPTACVWNHLCGPARKCLGLHERPDGTLYDSTCPYVGGGDVMAGVQGKIYPEWWVDCARCRTSHSTGESVRSKADWGATFNGYRKLKGEGWVCSNCLDKHGR